MALARRTQTVYNSSFGTLSHTMTKLLQPIWFRLPKRFYERLGVMAGSLGLEPEDALEFAIDLLGKFMITSKQNETGTKEFMARLWTVLRSQQKAADANQVNVLDAMEDAAKLYRIYGPINTPVPKHGDVSPARTAPGALGILYWSKIPPEERSRRAQELARKRWGAKKVNLPKAAGDDTKG
jgi:hypothetical protein